MEGFIVNGVSVSIDMYPFMALVTRLGNMHCGGVIMSQRVIATAAHCCFFEDSYIPFTELSVYLGSTKPKKGTGYEVCGMYSHKGYEIDWFTDDIGLLLLSETIIFGPRVQIARLPHHDWRKHARKLVVLGFGTLATQGPIADKLQMTVMNYLTNEICDRTQHMDGLEVFRVPPTMFCLIGERWTGDCFGDSGGPVISRGYVVGLINTGRDIFCGSDMMPSMYLDLYQYKDWLRENIQKLEDTNSTICKSLRYSDYF